MGERRGQTPRMPATKLPHLIKRLRKAAQKPPRPADRKPRGR